MSQLNEIFKEIDNAFERYQVAKDISDQKHREFIEAQIKYRKTVKKLSINSPYKIGDKVLVKNVLHKGGIFRPVLVDAVGFIGDVKVIYFPGSRSYEFRYAIKKVKKDGSISKANLLPSPVSEDRISTIPNP
jgi:hypothetical protein